MSAFPSNSPFFGGFSVTPDDAPWIPTQEEIDAVASEEVTAALAAPFRKEDLNTELKDLLAWVESNESFFEDDGSDGFGLGFLDELKSRLSRLIP